VSKFKSSTWKKRLPFLRHLGQSHRLNQKPSGPHKKKKNNGDLDRRSVERKRPTFALITGSLSIQFPQSEGNKEGERGRIAPYSVRDHDRFDLDCGRSEQASANLREDEAEKRKKKEKRTRSSPCN